MCCVCYGSQYGSIQRLNNWFSGSIHGTFRTFQYCRLLLSKRSSSPWRRGLGKSSEGSGRPFPGTIWELCDWRIQSKEGVRQEKKVGRREWKAPFFILSFTFSFKHLHIFFLNALLKSAMQTRKSSAKELTHFCWWEHRVRLASRQFLGLDYLVPHILRTLMDQVAKFGLWIDTSLLEKHLKSRKI